MMGHRDPWDSPQTVAAFLRASPNPSLLRFAEILAAERGRALEILDIGCGAGRNAVPLARAGHRVTGIDRSRGMLDAAARRARDDGVEGRVRFQEGVMSRLDVPPGDFDLVVAHGVWNLADSDRCFFEALSEAARAARADAGLFVFTFSRNTLPLGAEPLSGQRYVFTQWAGSPQVFLAEKELLEELEVRGFRRSGDLPFREHNLRSGGRHPVIYEGTWRKDRAGPESNRLEGLFLD